VGRFTSDTSPEALIFPTFGRGKRKGQIVPHDSKNFLRARIRPIARWLGIPDRLVTFQVMRRTLGTDLQHHGTLKDAQGALRHASIATTGNVYMQSIDESVFRAVNSRANAVLEGWKPAVEQLGRTGRQPKLGTIRRTSDELFPTSPNLPKGGASKLLN
jgi:integrase